MPLCGSGGVLIEVLLRVFHLGNHVQRIKRMHGSFSKIVNLLLLRGRVP